MEQPKLSDDLAYAVEVVNIQLKWEWPYGYHVKVSYRRSGEETFRTVRGTSDDAEHALDAVSLALTGIFGLA